ncbi:gluconokinase [Cryocola sp. 340MFSha3.1]|uniref:gluconokinase n=1 Tax=Cryocola sp. 340MFSha3.1 TaxID=1169145 RepID=UPI0003682442|nr:gluconokinase [Cryocola sp. 340MFSha3.1]
MTAIIVMGVSGSGKSTVGRELAHRLGLPFVDADDLHPEANRAKMAGGIPLTDEDRAPWLSTVARTIGQHASGVVVACSALRRRYRDAITYEAGGRVLFAHLSGEREVIRERMEARADHFMPPALLDSQLETLEPLGDDEDGAVFSIDVAPAQVAARIDGWASGAEQLDLQEVADPALGRIRITTVPLPGQVRVPSATYLPSGRLFLLFRVDGDPADWWRAAVVDDDGSDFDEVFAGPIPQRPTANGIRHMPFADGRRVLLGDHVLEATPGFDDPRSVDLVPVEYPWGLTDDPLTSHHWSEIIVSPDGERIAWTILRTDMTAVVALGGLRRDADRYTIIDPVIISSSDALEPDPERDGYFRAHRMLGGEVKQFVRGGTAISSVGDGGAPLTDSVIQDLLTDSIEPITRAPGYDETTILSPDERLGIVMTARASARTDPAFLGLLPRPHATLVTMPLAWVLYQYAVDGVRRFRPGNIGPVLIDVERSRNEPDYTGASLACVDGSWVYVSPMSWHSDGRHVSWMEMKRGSGDGFDRTLRIRTAELLDHVPGQQVPITATPATTPYAIGGPQADALLARTAAFIPSGRIAGAHSGHLEFERSSDGRGTWSVEARYVAYSDDGRNLYDGVERSHGSMASGAVYEADLTLTGDVGGEMHLRASWSGIGDGTRLLFGTADGGAPQSFGFARYGDHVRRIEDLLE